MTDAPSAQPQSLNHSIQNGKRRGPPRNHPIPLDTDAKDYHQESMNQHTSARHHPIFQHSSKHDKKGIREFKADRNSSKDLPASSSSSSSVSTTSSNLPMPPLTRSQSAKQQNHTLDSRNLLWNELQNLRRDCLAISEKLDQNQKQMEELQNLMGVILEILREVLLDDGDGHGHGDGEISNDDDYGKLDVEKDCNSRRQDAGYRGQRFKNTHLTDKVCKKLEILLEKYVLGDSSSPSKRPTELKDETVTVEDDDNDDDDCISICT
jgi:hypothetical protein